ncbi:MAG: peptide deformylase [Flavobacteriales bacterium]|nr:peptide deformylase [Flavobacteriales bacterium]
MILPIVAFGSSILREKCKKITKEYPNLLQLIADMHESMYAASGVGLAAPQINKAIRIFIIDTAPFSEDEQMKIKPIKQVFINPKMISEKAEEWSFNEGCLSIPGIREDIIRKSEIEIEFLDENFKTQIMKYGGITARVIQHEYDHLEGILFTDKISALRKRVLKGKLTDISKGKVDVSYKMRFPKR